MLVGLPLNIIQLVQGGGKGGQSQGRESSENIPHPLKLTSELVLTCYGLPSSCLGRACNNVITFLKHMPKLVPIAENWQVLS